MCFALPVPACRCSWSNVTSFALPSSLWPSAIVPCFSRGEELHDNNQTGNRFHPEMAQDLSSLVRSPLVSLGGQVNSGHLTPFLFAIISAVSEKRGHGWTPVGEGSQDPPQTAV